MNWGPECHEVCQGMEIDETFLCFVCFASILLSKHILGLSALDIVQFETIPWTLCFVYTEWAVMVETNQPTGPKMTPGVSRRSETNVSLSPNNRSLTLEDDELREMCAIQHSTNNDTGAMFRESSSESSSEVSLFQSTLLATQLLEGTSCSCHPARLKTFQI